MSTHTIFDDRQIALLPLHYGLQILEILPQLLDFGRIKLSRGRRCLLFLSSQFHGQILATAFKTNKSRSRWAREHGRMRHFRKEIAMDGKTKRGGELTFST